MHGFLNVLVAAALAPRVDGATLRQIVGEEEAHAFGLDDRSFSWRDLRISSDELLETRQHGFLSYGSCSFSEPTDDLVSLGFLQPR